MKSGGKEKGKVLQANEGKGRRTLLRSNSSRQPDRGTISQLGSRPDLRFPNDMFRLCLNISQSRGLRLTYLTSCICIEHRVTIRWSIRSARIGILGMPRTLTIAPKQYSGYTTEICYGTTETGCRGRSRYVEGGVSWRSQRFKNLTEKAIN